ncbi:MAG: ribokinase [Clostridia bacterium]|nr:ribokinase [Clostridia bacterium]
MVKIAVIGICGNSIFMNVDHFHQKGETIAANSVFEEIGGKGINQAVAAAKMGANVSFLGAIGDDGDGEKCRQTAKEYGINGFFAQKNKMRTTFAVILTDKNGENQVTGFRSAELEAKDVLDFEDEIANSDILLLQHEVPEEVNECAIEIAKKHNVKVILNPAPIRPIADKNAEVIFAVTPNEQERQAININQFKNVITTLGKNGCSINDKNFIKAIKVNPIDTTGAGDTFNGVFAVCLAEGMDIETACKYAVCASGISVTKKGVLTAIPTREEIERKMGNE